MRIPVVLISFVVSTAFLWGAAGGPPPLPLSGCEPPPEISKIIRDQLSGDHFDSLPFRERVALRRQVLNKLIAEYPREVEPQRLLIQWTWWYDQDHYPELMKRYRQMAEQHPDDPLALYLAGQVLGSPDPEQSIRYLERAKIEAPNFPWPSFELTFTYLAGKVADKRKAAENIGIYFRACPVPDADSSAYYLLSRAGSTDLQAHVATVLRARLEQETDPKMLSLYGVLWGLEFRTRPVQQHDQERKRIAVDLARLEALESGQQKPNVGLLYQMRKGYEEAGGPREKVASLDDRILSVPSHGDAALMIAVEHWRKTHPEPEDQSDTAAWAKRDAEWLAAARNWQREFPENHWAAHRLPFNAMKGDPTIPESDGMAALDDYLHDVTVYGQPDSGDYLSAAEFLVDHKWQPARALALARMAQTSAVHDYAQEDALDGNEAAEDLKLLAGQRILDSQKLNGVFLRAAALAGDADAARSIRASVESNPPQDDKLVSGYWLNRARLAELDGRRPDALAYYQKALYARVAAPKPFHGKLKDDLTAESTALWKQMGGSETAWAVWSKPPANRPVELAESHWEKATKTMPSFELVDLAGKNWRMQSLAGKTVLINVWATWCGFCVAELPKLEKLYEQTKDRPDIQILTFNIDDDLGLAAPFVKEHGYRFPVLPALGLVNQLLDSVGIPQNWVLDSKGVWRWTEMGYNAADSNWSAEIEEKLASVRGEKLASVRGDKSASMRN